MRTPVIAQVHGYCLAGGSELASYCDLFVVADEFTLMLADKGWREALRELMEAGLDSLPGGGAEIFADRVRRKIARMRATNSRGLKGLGR